MIAATLIPDDILNEIFEGGQERFLAIALVARKNLEDALNGGASGSYAQVDWRAQYVHELSEIADALGVTGLPSFDNPDINSDQVAAFDIALARILTRIRISRGPTNKSETVELSVVTKASIKVDLEELRQRINVSNLSDDLKKSLHKKVDAVEAEIDKKRSTLSPMWILSGALMMLGGVSDITGTLADARPAAELISSVQASFEHDKKMEIAEETRLHGQPLQITHIENKLLPSP